MAGTVQQTKCYTYKVEMIVQVLANDLATAASTLNTVGGHLTSRKTELLNTTEIPVELNKIDLTKNK
jgi:hypothetical protein